jgi:hypothetical protein
MLPAFNFQSCGQRVGLRGEDPFCIHLLRLRTTMYQSPRNFSLGRMDQWAASGLQGATATHCAGRP